MVSLRDDVRVAFRQEILSEALALCEGRPVGDLHRSCIAHLHGVLAMRRGLTHLAIAYLRRAIELDPTPPSVFHHLGDALRGQHQAGALAAHLHALKLAPASMESYVRLAQTLQQQRRHSEAVVMCLEALRLQPQDVAARQMLGDSLHAQGRFMEAIAAYDTAIEHAPNDLSLRLRLGRCCAASGDDSRAINELQEALLLQPDHAELNIELADVLLRSGRPGDVEGVLDVALNAVPLDVRANRLYVIVLQLLGRRQEIARAWLGLGAGLEAGQHAREAGAAYRQALADASARVRALRCLARTHVVLGDSVGAVALLEEAVGLDPRHAIAHVELGLALQQTDQSERSWDELAWYHHPSAPHWLHVEQPLWDGSPLNGQTILLWTVPEQSETETVLALRYVQFAKRCGGHVMVQCDRSLLPFCR